MADDGKEEKDENETTSGLTPEQREAILSRAPKLSRVVRADGTVLELGMVWRAFGKEAEESGKRATIAALVLHTDDKNQPTHVDVYARHEDASTFATAGRVAKVTIFPPFDSMLQVLSEDDAKREREHAILAKSLAMAAQVAELDAAAEDESSVDVVEIATQLVAHRNMPPKEAARKAFEILQAVDQVAEEVETEEARKAASAEARPS